MPFASRYGFVHDVGIGDCVGQDLTITYDEASRTITWSQSGGTTCSERTASSTADAEGLPYRATVDHETTFDFTTLQTGEICVD
jgi:hypothetical protein